MSIVSLRQFRRASQRPKLPNNRQIARIGIGKNPSGFRLIGTWPQNLAISIKMIVDGGLILT
jgi:hypothetical protein